MKKVSSLTVFKSKIEKWVPQGIPRRLFKNYVEEVSFI